MTAIYFPGNTARLDAIRRSAAWQVIPDRKRGGYVAIHNPIATSAIIGGNTSNIGR